MAVPDDRAGPGGSESNRLGGPQMRSDLRYMSNTLRAVDTSIAACRMALKNRMIAKHAESTYKSGKRSPEWRKLKIVQEQEFVMGGWTEPRQTRAYFGALLLGVYRDEEAARSSRHRRCSCRLRGLCDRASRLRRSHRHRLRPSRTRSRDEAVESPRNAGLPIQPRPHTNERPHWVRPELVAQIKFTEWTADNKLRHPVYLGLREDKKPGTCDENRRSGSPLAQRSV